MIQMKKKNTESHLISLHDLLIWHVFDLHGAKNGISLTLRFFVTIGPLLFISAAAFYVESFSCEMDEIQTYI